MTGLLIGYARCSTDTQDLTSQRNALMGEVDLATTQGSCVGAPARERPCRRRHDLGIAGDYEAATGRAIVAAVSKQPQAAMVLVPHHGPFTWGIDATAAVTAASILEHIATVAHLTLSLDPAARGPAQAVIDRHYSRKHGTHAYYGQPT